MAGGLTIGVVSMILIAWSTPAAILVGVSLGAVAGGSVQALVTALTGDLVNQEQRGQAIGLLHTVGDLGSAVAPPVAYALLPRIELSGVYLVSAGLFAIGLILALISSARTANLATPAKLEYN
jgi:MFS family permease